MNLLFAQNAQEKEKFTLLSHDRPIVVKLNGKKQNDSVSRPTDAELQNEYNYILAENLTKKLLEKGLISVDEFDKIMEKNRRTFSPLFSRI